MQGAALEVEENILVVERLKNKSRRRDNEKKKHKEEKLPTASTSHNY